jgi:putative flippase GtrA
MNILAQLKAGQWQQVLRYLVVGGLNTALSFAVYILAIKIFDTPYYLASLISILFGIAVGFKAHGRFVFGNKGSFLRYLGCWASIYAVNTLLIALIRDYTGDIVGQLLVLPFTTVASYFLMKKLVYRTNADTNPATSATTQTRE